MPATTWPINLSDPYAAYKIQTVECPRCDAVFGVPGTGLDQDGACPGCGAWLHLTYDAECVNGTWQGGYDVMTR